MAYFFGPPCIQRNAWRNRSIPNLQKSRHSDRQFGSASEMTHIVSGGALNSTNSTVNSDTNDRAFFNYST